MDTLLTDDWGHWFWWGLGFLLLIAEVLTTTTFCLWMSFAAFATGLVLLIFPSMGWPAQGVLAALLSLVAVGAWFRFRRRAGNAPDNGLNQRGRSYVGRVLTLKEAIVNGVGQARLEDSVWRVTGPDLPMGASVRVVRADGSTLQVEAAPATENLH
jgi:membrane protein implicated in regulation of membrane protease activity